MSFILLQELLVLDAIMQSDYSLNEYLWDGRITMSTPLLLSTISTHQTILMICHFPSYSQACNTSKSGNL